MARKGKHTHSANHPRRDSYTPRSLARSNYDPLADLLLDRLPGRSLPTLAFQPPPEVRSTLMDVEDFRTWTPSRVRRPKTLRGNPSRVSHSQAAPVRRKYTYQTNFDYGLGFTYPKHVVLCVRRHRRREVLHALRKTGRGGRWNRKPRRNQWSNVKC